MMSPILQSTAVRYPFTPPWLENEEVPPCFYLRAGSLAERSAFEAELEARGAGDVWPFRIAEAFAGGVRAFLPDNVDEANALIELDAQRRSGETLSADDKVRLDAVHEQIAEHWPDMFRLRRQQAMRAALLPALALQHFCVGWDHVGDTEGQPLAFKANAIGRVEDDVLARVDALQMRVAGMAAYGLQYARSAEKNSAPPSKSAVNRRASRAVSRGRGKSAVTSGKTTR